jgi:hypothetical protein
MAALQKNSRAGRLLVVFGSVLMLAGTALAQSLDPHEPAPLQSGPNSGTVDNFGGANYFYFWAGPGESTITATYRNVNTWAQQQATNLTVELYDEHRTWVSRATISSLKESSQRRLVGTLQKETKLILAVIPPSGGLLRTGGDYEMTATGVVRFDKPPTATELVVGTYTPLMVYDNENTAVKLKPDGTLEFASGTLGTWKVFSADDRIYTVSFLSNRLSLKLIPGRGLVEAGNPTSIVFKANR